MQTIYNSAGIPFYQGYAAPESLFDDLYNQIKNGSYYVDILNKNIYTMSNNAWVAVTDNTTLSSLVPTTDIIQTVETNTINGLYLFQTKTDTYYTTDRAGVLSVYLPAVQGNTGRWVAIEDSLSYGVNIMDDPAQRFRVANRLGGITGVVSKHYFFCDGVKWHLVKSFLPVSSLNATSNRIFVDADNGNDSTGVKYDSSKPFKTVSQALFIANSGDIIHVKTGNYTDHNMFMKNGVEVYLEKNAIISPTANNGYLPIFQVSGASNSGGTPGIFKITGKGKLINKAGTSSNGVCSIENAFSMNVVLEAEEVSILSLYNNGLGTGSYTINNTTISMELYTRGGMWSLNNCTIKDCKTTTFNMDWGGAQVIFNNCTFIRQQVTIPYEQSYNVDIIGQNTVTSQGSQGLSNYAFGPTTGNGGNRKTSFINCLFYNIVGGDAITFKNTSSNSATLVVSGCKFYSSDNTKKALLADGVAGTPTTPNYYFDNNVSNMALGTANGGTVANLLTGSGFQINSNYFIANPLPYTAYVIV